MMTEFEPFWDDNVENPFRKIEFGCFWGITILGMIECGLFGMTMFKPFIGNTEFGLFWDAF